MLECGSAFFGTSVWALSIGGLAYQCKAPQETCHRINGSQQVIDGFISIKTEEKRATKCRPAILGLQSRYWGKLHVDWQFDVRAFDSTASVLGSEANSLLRIRRKPTVKSISSTIIYGLRVKSYLIKLLLPLVLDQYRQEYRQYAQCLPII